MGMDGTPNGEHTVRLNIFVAALKVIDLHRQRHSIRETLYKFYHLIFSDGDFGFFENRLGRLCRDMAISSSEMGKIDQAFDELDKMCEHMEKYQKFTNIEHTSLLVRGLKYDSSQSGSSDEATMPLMLKNTMKINMESSLKNVPV